MSTPFLRSSKITFNYIMPSVLEILVSWIIVTAVCKVITFVRPHVRIMSGLENDFILEFVSV